MARLKHKDILDIMRLFEIELNSLRNVRKIEKMKLRKQIFKVVSPALSINNLKPKFFMTIMDDKIGHVIDMFLDGQGFKNKLLKKVDQKLKK